MKKVMVLILGLLFCAAIIISISIVATQGWFSVYEVNVFETDEGETYYIKPNGRREGLAWQSEYELIGMGYIYTDNLRPVNNLDFAGYLKVYKKDGKYYILLNPIQMFFG